MAGGSIRGVEYVVTDDARKLIAVVRPTARRRPRRVPRWAQDKDIFVVVGPDGASGLAGRAGRRPRWPAREVRVLVNGSSLVGVIAPGWTYTVRECTCGQPYDRCQCGGRRGKVRPCSAT
jgi:hypothetical protein